MNNINRDVNLISYMIEPNTTTFRTAPEVPNINSPEFNSGKMKIEVKVLAEFLTKNCDKT